MTASRRLTSCRAAAFVALAAGAAAAASPLPEPGFPQACGVQLKPPTFTVETLEQAHAMGFRLVRRGFYWNGVEKEKGTYDFSSLDPQMARARELGLTVVACLFSSNALYEDTGRGGITTEAGRQGFAAFAAAAAAHYKGQSIVWEVWNEPNVRTFWRKDGVHNTEPFADEYTALVKAVVPAMLKADPDCFVVAGSVSNYWEPSYQWTEFCFQKGILATGIRGWSVHPYGVKTPEEHAIGHARTRALLVKYGAPDLPMVNTERGYAVAKTATGEGWSGGEAAKMLEYQADHFVRQLLVDQLCGVRFSSWYEWGGNEGFGLWQPDGSPRPVVAAMKDLVAQLGGYHIAERLESDSTVDYLLLCRNAKGEQKLVAWTSPPAGGSPDETWDHEVAVDMGPGQAPRTLKLTGRPQYTAVPAEAKVGKSVTTSARPVAAAVTAGTPAGGTDLKAFEAGRAWNFTRNTGEGSFELGRDADGTPIGILTYDFSKANSKTTPYVIASTPLDSVGAAAALTLFARSPIAQPLTFRVVDSTGQTLQFKTRLKGTGAWEPIRFPLDRKLENWDGAKDGYPHFPLKSLVFSVPKPGDTLTGKVEYAALSAAGSGTAPTAPAAAPAPVAAPAATQLAPAAAPVVALPAGGQALNLFDGGVAWSFVKNTGEGSFTLAKDPAGKAIGVMAFDFANAKANSTPYVLATAPVSVPGGSGISLQVRTAVAQKLTFRVVDSTGQTLQFKTKTAGGGAWEQVRIPLDRKLEHWDGANDGQVRFPLKSIVFSVPQPAGEANKAGKVEYADAIAN